MSIVLSNVKPGDYTARICLWEDEMAQLPVLLIQVKLLLLFNAILTVNNYAAIDIIKANYDFGQVTQGDVGQLRLLVLETPEMSI